MTPADIHDYLLGLVRDSQKRGQCPPDGIDDAALTWLMREKARTACAFWEYDALTGTLRAADPGKPTPLVFTRAPFFAFHAGELLRHPRWPLLLCVGSRGAVNAQRDRLIDRLAARQQLALAGALRDIHLEQDGAHVRGIYDPEGFDLRLSN